MIKDKKIFIRILKDIVHDETSDWLNERTDLSGDLENLAKFAENQALLGLIYAHLKNTIPKDQLPALFKSGFDSDVYLSVNREIELEEVRNTIPEDIPFVLMKGMVVRRYYPCYYFRSMGDIDFIIHPEHKKICDSVMLKLGYDKLVNNHNVWNYTKENVEFEIHNHMFYEKLSNNVDYMKYFDGVWDHLQRSEFGHNIWEPTPEFHLLYMITHHAKHTLNKGHGFRAYLDFVFFCRQEGQNMDWDWVKAELKKLKLYNFTRVVFAFCERWFHVQMPLHPGKLDDVFYQRVTEKMFEDGMFGLDNEEKLIGNDTKVIARTGKLYWLSAIRLTVKKIFPPYADMILAPWYHFLAGRPWLLPAAWVYRWFYVLTHEFRHSIDLLTMPFLKRKQISERKKMIKNWRL